MKILVIDDHSLIREAIHGVLKEIDADAEIFDAKDCRDAEKVLQSDAARAPDLTLLDLNLPDRDGFSLLPTLRERFPSMAVVVLAGDQDRASITRALELGACGFIPKSASRDIMLSALRLVCAGGVYVPPEILARDAAAPSHPPKRVLATSPAELGLTGRQIDVLALMMEGKSNKAIARALNLAEPTVKNHITAILRALGASNRTEAVVAATNMRWKVPLSRNTAVPT